MKNVLKTMTLFALAVVIALPLSAEDKKKKKGGKKSRNPLVNVVKKVKDAGADEDTLEKVEALAKEYGAKLTEANEGLGDALKQRREAAAKAKADGKTGKDLQAAVNAAVKLTDEQKDAMKKAQGIRQDFNKAVAALLTPEQAKAAGVAGKGGGKKKKKKKKDE